MAALDDQCVQSHRTNRAHVRLEIRRKQSKRGAGLCLDLPPNLSDQSTTTVLLLTLQNTQVNIYSASTVHYIKDSSMIRLILEREGFVHRGAQTSGCRWSMQMMEESKIKTSGNPSNKLLSDCPKCSEKERKEEGNVVKKMSAVAN
ncbi:hypothetical protein WMY93_011905 [Mugilogobius chulae]|uniref:Uncharacterized protein n=1 Tax=Mugilogobius chulae TaxID=88201 RepID=A0AAW0P7P2_9GOBI